MLPSRHVVDEMHEVGYLKARGTPERRYASLARYVERLRMLRNVP